MARVVDAKYSTIIGTPARIRELLNVLIGASAVVDLKFTNFVPLEKEPSEAVIIKALELTPRRQK